MKSEFNFTDKHKELLKLDYKERKAEIDKLPPDERPQLYMLLLGRSYDTPAPREDTI